MYTLNTIEVHCVAIEHHPNDSRAKIAEDGKVQTLTERMGTGGGNVPLVVCMETFHCYSAEEKAMTIRARDYKDPQLIAYGIDQGASRDVGELFLEEKAKTVTNGTCPGHHNGVVICKGGGVSPKDGSVNG